MPDATTFGAAVQNILTRGLDAATAYYSNRLTVNDPTGSVTGPNGQRVNQGQSARTPENTMLAGVPQWVLIAGGVALVLAVVVPLLRR